MMSRCTSPASTAGVPRSARSESHWHYCSAACSVNGWVTARHLYSRSQVLSWLHFWRGCCCRTWKYTKLQSANPTFERCKTAGSMLADNALFSTSSCSSPESALSTASSRNTLGHFCAREISPLWR